MATVTYIQAEQSSVVRNRLMSGVVTRTALALMGCSLAVMALLLSDVSLRHWFVVPVVLCGAVIGSDAIAYLQGRLQLMDPAALIGVLGMHFFFLAPLLHVLWDSWTPYVIGPPDWRDWLGWMASLNLLGLLFYRLVGANTNTDDSWQPTRNRTLWRLDQRRTTIVITALLLVSGLAQIWAYAHFGGISGYVETYLDSEKHYGSKEDGIGFNGMGWLFSIAESFPILSLFAFTNYLRNQGKKPGWIFIFAVLAAYFALVMLFGGLRGSRSNTIWALFWAVGVIHFRVRNVTRSFTLVGVAFLLVFMYLYGFYKSLGADALDAFQGAETRDMLARKTGRTWQSSILGDLGRSDVQALALYRLVVSPAAYEYAWGRTYLGGVCILIPRFIMPNRPPEKVRWTTELESGPGSYVPAVRQSSHVYGLAGEAMLNFGPVVVPLAYLILGLIVRQVRRWLTSLAPDDSRWLIAPVVIMFTFILMTSDSDNDVYFLFKYAFVPLGAIILSSRRERLIV